MSFLRWQNRTECYCAYCSIPRKIYSQKHISFLDLVLSLVAAFIVSHVIWSEWTPKAMVLFAVFSLFAEIFIQTRWRTTLMCPYCHFDPVLYIRDKDALAQRIQTHFSSHKNDLMFQAMKKSKMNIPERPAPPAP